MCQEKSGDTVHFRAIGSSNTMCDQNWMHMDNPYTQQFTTFELVGITSCPLCIHRIYPSVHLRLFVVKSSLFIPEADALVCFTSFLTSVQ